MAADFYKNPFIKEVIHDTRVKVLRDLLAAKFGRLPNWVDEELEDAKAPEIERWFRKLLSADTLEGVLGKKASST